MEAVEIETVDWVERAHTQAIVFLEQLANPGIILSTARDGLFKMWNKALEPLSSWNIHSENQPSWNFPFDWQESRKDELRSTIQVLEHIGESKRDLEVLE